MSDFYRMFVAQLKEIYSAEKQEIHLFPEMIQAAKSGELKKWLKIHFEETKNQVKRLEQIGSELKENLGDAQCEAMKGLLKEWMHVVQPHYQDDVQDAAIIAFIQKIKHYEIALYGSLKTFAKHLKKDKIESWLKESIKEEWQIDKKLTEIAEGHHIGDGINCKACKKSA